MHNCDNTIFMSQNVCVYQMEKGFWDWSLLQILCVLLDMAGMCHKQLEELGSPQARFVYPLAISLARDVGKD